MNNSRWKLGWFNAWVGLIWFFLFIPSIKFFFAYETFLQDSFAHTLVYQVRIEIKHDSSEIKIITEKGTYYHYNKNNYSLIVESLNSNKPVEIWYDKEDMNIVDFKINKEFLINRSSLGIGLYFIGFIISGGMIVLSTILIIKTKGWGTYELLEKYRKNNL